MSLSTEDVAAVRREVEEFKAAQRLRKPTSMVEELTPANELLQRLIARYGSEVCPVINEILCPNDHGQKPRRRRRIQGEALELDVALDAANDLVARTVARYGEEATQRIFLSPETS